jgi:DNA-binding XRE family transcriptional regulator
MKISSNTFIDVYPVTTESNTLRNQSDCVMTQAEVAEAIGISRVAVQQIENRAIEKFKRELRRRRINALDLI